MDPVVRFRAAVCLLGRFPALAGLDLDVDAGEIVLLSGPNGAGKTTLLRAAAGLVPVVQGEALVCGHDLRVDRRAVRPYVGLLGHAGGLYADLTVRENVTFWARAAGRGVDPIEALRRAGLDPRLERVAVDRLSAGQRRRTALAVLLVRQPALWLLDEPHAGLDADGRDLLDALVTDAAAGGATVLLASHELERATPLATRQVVVAGGTSGEATAGGVGTGAAAPSSAVAAMPAARTAGPAAPTAGPPARPAGPAARPAGPAGLAGVGGHVA